MMVELFLPTETQGQPDKAVETLAGLLSTMYASRPPTRSMHRISRAHETALCLLAKTNPAAFSAVFRCGKVHALHIVCKLGPSLQTLKAVHEAFPSAIYAKNSYDQLPIHHGCYNSASLEVIKFLVQQYPESLSAMDKSHQTPLHNSCCGRMRPIQVDIIAFLLETYPRAALSRSCSGVTPLTKLLHNYGDFYGDIPEEAVRLLLQAAPEAVLSRDLLNNRLPIDHAMIPNRRTPISAQVLELLLRNTPHVTLNAIWKNRPANWKVRMQALSYFHRVDNDEAQLPTPGCCPPLHAIMQCRKQLEPEHYLESIDKFRGNISHADHKGRLPLHVALEPSSLVPPKAIAKMVEMEPRALMVRHPISGLYPWMMAASRKYSTEQSSVVDGEILSSIYTALRSNPTPFLSSLHGRKPDFTCGRR